MDDVGQEPAGHRHHGDRRHRDRQPLGEALASPAGLGDQEGGDQDAEVDEDAVGLDHAELGRAGPLRGDRAQRREREEQAARQVEGARGPGAGGCPEDQQRDDQEPDADPRDVAGLEVEAALRSPRPARSRAAAPSARAVRRSPLAFRAMRGRPSHAMVPRKRAVVLGLGAALFASALSSFAQSARPASPSTVILAHRPPRGGGGEAAPAPDGSPVAG